ncbi:Acid ceramidase 2 [Seiridium cupressi]
MAQTSPKDPIPTYQIDLSRPPETRYDEISRDFGPRMRSLQGLFDEVLATSLPIAILRRTIARVARLLVRRVYDEEEMLELKGIARATGVELYLLVTLNNLLDCLLGCTSGAAMVNPSKGRRKGVSPHLDEPRLMQFRTLDWGMDGLRDLLIILEFVDSRTSGSKVLARSITYAGFVVIDSGLREDLSLSLNFRPNHVCSTRTLRHHQLMVLLGRRRSVGSVLRSTILDTQFDPDDAARVPGLIERANKLAEIQTAPCYLILCDGSEVAVLEKDFTTGKVRSSKDFMLHTNHDVDHPINPNPKEYSDSSMLGHEEWLEESTHRKECFEKKWARHCKKGQTNSLQGDGGIKLTTIESSSSRGTSAVYPVEEPTLKRWVRSGTTMAECTHFACIMDPGSGQIGWIQRGPVAQEE